MFRVRRFSSSTPRSFSLYWRISFTLKVTPTFLAVVPFPGGRVTNTESLHSDLNGVSMCYDL